MAVSLDKVKVILKESTNILSVNLRPDLILPDLVDETAISSDDFGIINRENTDREKIYKLLGILKTSPVTSYEALIKWLEQNRNDLYIKVKDIQDKHCGKPSQSAQPPPAPATFSGNASDKLDDDDIRFITKKLGLTRNQLKNLYQEIGLKDDEIENAERDADTNDFKLQASKVLKYWRQKKGKDATKGAILQAMKDELNDTMESLMKKWEISSI